eukprot:scaffold25994_cov40-Attheya_sp.AAC.1
MSDARLAKLNGIGFQFVLRTLASWETRFEQLEEYKNEHVHTNVPWRSGQLGRWVSTQRKEYHLLKAGKKSYMSDDRLAKLNRLGFQFRV